jgi:hypothetical protein
MKVNITSIYTLEDLSKLLHRDGIPHSIQHERIKIETSSPFLRLMLERFSDGWTLFIQYPELIEVSANVIGYSVGPPNEVEFELADYGTVWFRYWPKKEAP